MGCGGGRVCLHLQERGLRVVGIDSSPGAVAICRRRGVSDARVLAIDAIDDSLGLFDTVVMLGQNFGMLGSRTRARSLLGRFARLTTPRGRIVAETFDPSQQVTRKCAAAEKSRRWSRSPALGSS